jgi:predicted SprT family Zn-dependent metalloprotease
MISSLQSIYKKFNNFFFNDKLPEIQFKIDASRKTIAKFLDDQKIIYLGSSCVSLSKEELYSAILHEMIHIHNKINEVDDVNDNQYHNSFFMKEAVRVGFFVFREKYQGWASTHINAVFNASSKDCKYNQDKNDILKKLLSEMDLSDSDMEQHEKVMREHISNLKPSKTFFLKYECACPPPYNSIRSGRRPNGNNAPIITCERCKTQFTCVSVTND